MLLMSIILVFSYQDFLRRDVTVYEHGVNSYVHGVLLPKLCNIAESSYPRHFLGFFLSVNKCEQ